MVPIEWIVETALSQQGDTYIFGAEASVSDSDPEAFDCSELIEWACGRNGVDPRMPDGSWIQARHCRNYGTLIDVDEAIETRGALLFKFKGDPFTGGRPSSAHVAMSLGNGQTMEARSSRYGVGMFSAYNRGWTHAGRIPGCDYTEDTDHLEEDPMIEQGHPNEEVVVRIQENLKHWDSNALPRYGADGDYGGETALWVSKFQTEKGVPATGKVDGLTMALLEAERPGGGLTIHDHDAVVIIPEQTIAVPIPGQTIRIKTEDAS